MIDFAPCRARLKASTVLTSGLGSPLRTKTPTPTRAITTLLPATSLPCLRSASAGPSPRITTSDRFAVLDEIRQSESGRIGDRDLVTRCSLELRDQLLERLIIAPGDRSLSSAAVTQSATPQHQSRAAAAIETLIVDEIPPLVTHATRTWISTSRAFRPATRHGQSMVHHRSSVTVVRVGIERRRPTPHDLYHAGRTCALFFSDCC